MRIISPLILLYLVFVPASGQNQPCAPLQPCPSVFLTCYDGGVESCWYCGTNYFSFVGCDYAVYYASVGTCLYCPPPPPVGDQEDYVPCLLQRVTVTTRCYEDDEYEIKVGYFCCM